MAAGGFTAGMVDARFFFHTLEFLFGGADKKAKEIDAATGAGAASDAKGRVPEDSGRLLNGIQTEQGPGGRIVSAHAISPHGGHADYALFVEKGHGSGVADGEFFNGDGAAAIGRGGQAKGAAPHPFFYPAVSAWLGARERQIEQLFDGLFDRAAS